MLPSNLCVLAVSSGLACGSAVVGQCNNPVWSPEFGVTGSGLSRTGNDMIVFDPDGTGPLPSELYIAGDFQNAGGVPGTAGIAKWNGQAWSSVGGGMAGSSVSTNRLCTLDADGPGPGLPVLVAVGWFTAAGGTSAYRVAAWNGASWSAFGSGAPTDLFSISGICEHDPDGEGPGLPQLVMIGEPQTWPGGIDAYAWNGSTWAPLPDAGELAVHCVASFDPDGAGGSPPSLVVGLKGNPGILRLHSGAWEPLGGGLSVRSGVYRCDSMCVVDEDGPGPQNPRLWVGGFFTHAGTVYSPGLARWDGQQWLAGPSGVGGFIDSVHDIATVDYTNGVGAPDVYLTTLGRVNRWNPRFQAWSVVGTIEYFEPMARTAIAGYRAGEAEPSLYLVGWWTNCNGVPSDKFARMKCEPCYANCDGSSGVPRLTSNEFMCFMNRFANRDPYANCDGSTGTPQLTSNDFQCFINKFAGGCS